MRSSLMLVSLAACGSPGGYDAGPYFYDAGQTDVTCHVIDWLGVERPLEHLEREPNAFQPLATSICSCGVAEGFASCSFNPGNSRFDGTCVSCAAQLCRPGVFMGHSCDCGRGAFDGVVRCTGDGGYECSCGSVCLSGASTSQRYSTCRCADGVPGVLDCAEGGAGVCDCSATRPYFVDGGR